MVLLCYKQKNVSLALRFFAFCFLWVSRYLHYIIVFVMGGVGFATITVPYCWKGKFSWNGNMDNFFA